MSADRAAGSGAYPSSNGPLIPVPRGLLRDVATYLYQHGDDLLREHVERYAWDVGPQDDEPLRPDFQARLEAAVERGQEARRNDRASLGLADPHGFVSRDAHGDLRDRIVRTLDYTDSLLRLPGLNADLARVLRAVHNSLCTTASSPYGEAER